MIPKFCIKYTQVEHLNIGSTKSAKPILAQGHMLVCYKQKSHLLSLPEQCRTVAVSLYVL